MRQPLPVSRSDAVELTEFLRSADLTVSGIGEPEARVWIDRDVDGRIVGSAGFELEGVDALLRSVAVHPSRRSTGRGTEHARFALDAAASLGARRAWLFSHRSGPFWQKLGFESADIAELAKTLGSTNQVRAFAASGQLGYETAWSRALPLPPPW